MEGAVLAETGSLADVNGYGRGERGRLQLLVLLHFQSLLQLVVVDYVLVRGAALRKRVQLIHLVPESQANPYYLYS